MDAESSEAKRRNQLPDLDSLDVASLKALVLAKHTEIENLNLLVLKPRSACTSASGSWRR